MRVIIYFTKAIFIVNVLYGNSYNRLNNDVLAALCIMGNNRLELKIDNVFFLSSHTILKANQAVYNIVFAVRVIYLNLLIFLFKVFFGLRDNLTYILVTIAKTSYSLLPNVELINCKSSYERRIKC